MLSLYIKLVTDCFWEKVENQRTFFWGHPVPEFVFDPMGSALVSLNFIFMAIVVSNAKIRSAYLPPYSLVRMAETANMYFNSEKLKKMICSPVEK